MPLSLSQRAARTVQSEIRVMSVECEKAKGINLAQGVCDTEVPAAVREGAHAAMDGGVNSYTRAEGLAPVRQAIAEKMLRFNGLQCDPETEVIVHSGSTGAFYSACLALLNPGDEVILFEPYYGYHLNTLAAVEAVPSYVTLQAPDWTFTPENLAAAVSPRTRAIVLNSPANPSGKVFTRREMEWIAEFARRHDLFVFTDEIYEYFIYEGRHISIATLPGMRERTITMSGYSKTFSITGWRIGYSVADQKWTQAMAYFHDLVYVCAPAPLQMGVAEGILKLPQSFYQEISKEYVRKRDMLCNTLKEVGLTPSVPKGAYYVLADASALPGKPSKEKAMALLRQTGVATVAGSAFYHATGGENLLRFCYAKTDAELEEACRRLERLRKNSDTPAAAKQPAPSLRVDAPPSFHVVIEGRDAKAYWLHVALKANASLEQLDTFLRETWLECCGHQSAFIIEGRRYSSQPMTDVGESGMDVLVGQVLAPGARFFYEYDFGSTTELTLTTAARLEPQEQPASVQLLARNEIPRVVCENCGGSTMATVVCSNCAWKGKGWLCEKCIATHECRPETLLPVVNSPRVGVCTYGGQIQPVR
ncbi:MAG TPA: aminotransferase class I/II-fold pyridoxal phosphate-dependent enzyme [Verrucomicrobiae bacterium]|jgi:aminotransferase|nr:aminotransferase class I/II-fold pyridoxal phosphate-dependent enzyme [Verrucomicrobiae bacterium]